MIPFESTTHRCTNPACAHQEWNVTPDLTLPEVWHLRGAGVFTLAGSEPICPMCTGPLTRATSASPEAGLTREGHSAA